MNGQVQLFLRSPQDQHYLITIGHPDLLTFGGRYLGNAFATLAAKPRYGSDRFRQLGH